MSETNTVEGVLRHISKLRKDFHVSCDIYHDDLCDDMVVKLSLFADDAEDVKHFRNPRLIDSLLDALFYFNQRRSAFVLKLKEGE